MLRNLTRRHALFILLAALLALNAFRYWPAKRPVESARSGWRPPSPPGVPGPDGSLPGPGPDGFPDPDPAMRERMEAALQKMPAAQRQAMEDRMKADRAFFDSLRDLPEEQRRQKMREHFAQNPPPPGLDGGPPPPGGPGGPGNGDPAHLPSPDVRQSMDQQIANSQKAMRGQ